MSHELTFGGDPEDALVTAHGKASVDELDRIFKDLLHDPRYRPGMLVLADHRDVDWSGLTHDHLRQRIDRLEEDAELMVGSSFAVVLGQPLDYGIQRMLQALAESQRVEGDRRAFYSLEDARAWLATRPRT